MNRLLVYSLAALFACITPALAKKSAATDGPFLLGNHLEMLSRTDLKTAEIAAYNPELKRLYIVGEMNMMEVVDISDPTSPKPLESFILDGNATSVTSFGNLLGVSILAEPSYAKGSVEIISVGKDSIRKLYTVPVCNQPDMVTFTPDGKMLLAACEGEPSVDGTVDSEGGMGILDMTPVAAGNAPGMTVIPFEDKSIEPEYITVSDDSKIAWMSLQENNAMARVNLTTKSIEKIFDLGYVDHSKKGFGIDAIKDGKIQIQNEPIRGLRQPDGVKHFEVNGKHYVATANEGAEVKNFDPKTVCGTAKDCSVKFGSRSVSIFDGESGKLVWDSGELLEQTFAQVAPAYFNWNSKKNKKKVDARSDDMGSEPENITIGTVGKSSLAFLGMERMSGVAVFDFSSVGVAGTAPKLLDYYMDPKDRGPEGILFISAEQSPTQTPLLVVCYEYSKTLVIYKLNP